MICSRIPSRQRKNGAKEAKAAAEIVTYPINRLFDAA